LTTLASRPHGIAGMLPGLVRIPHFGLLKAAFITWTSS
jgi:hypothetical protein